MRMSNQMGVALAWMAVRGGDGLIDRYGRLLMRGELWQGFKAPSLLHLVCMGYVSGGSGRIFLTQSGWTHYRKNKTALDDRLREALAGLESS